MTDISQGPGWWQASDGKWYAPETAPSPAPPASPAAESPNSAPQDAKEAKAEAKAAQARAKALRPWYKKKRFIGLGVIAIIVIIIIAASSGSKSSNTNSTPTTVGGSTGGSPTTAAPGTPGLNQVAADGSFAFTVTSVDCNKTTLGTTISTDAPAGTQWCLVNLTVKNVKTSAQSFFASNQKGTDAKGNQLSADSGALIYIDTGGSSALSTVNPGVTIQTTVPFQLAIGDTIKSLQLHDSAFSNGVTVNVS